MDIIIVFSLVFALNYVCRKLYLSNKLNRILSTSIWIVIIIWYSIPGILFLILDNGDDKLSILFQSVTRNNFLQSFALESLITVCVVVALMKFSSHITDKNTASFCVFLSDTKSQKYLLFLFTFALFFNLFFAKKDYDYLSLNSAENYTEITLSQKIIHLINVVLLATTTLVAIYSKNRKIYLLAFLLIFISSVLDFVTGARFSILTVVFVFILKVFVQKNIIIEPKRILFFACLFFVGMNVLMPIFSTMQDKRGEGIDFVEVAKETTFKNDYLLYARVAFTKLDSFSTGYLLTANEGVGGGGLLPYVGSALVFLPRNIFPNRPIAGSSDGTIGGHPSRLVPKSINIISDSLNVGVSPVQITLWQWGYIGILIFIIATVFYLKYINWLLNSQDIMIKTLGMFLIGIPTFHEIFLASDVALKNFVFSISIIITLLSVRKLYNR